MRLLLDAHVPTAIAEDLRRRGIDVLSIQGWQQASYRHARDNNILEAAATDERTLVTFNLSTIPDLLREFEGRAQKVTVDRGSEASYNVRVIPAAN